MSDTRNSRYWHDFEVFATEQGISLENEDDWKAWWDCFHAGVMAAQEEP